MNPKLIDLVERAGWTFVQAAAAVVLYAIVHTSDVTGLDWRGLLAGAAAAGALSVVKTLGIQASLLALLAQLAGQATPVVDGQVVDAATVEHAGATPPPGAVVDRVAAHRAH